MSQVSLGRDTKEVSNGNEFLKRLFCFQYDSVKLRSMQKKKKNSDYFWFWTKPGADLWEF
jgi:hypothetical protein